MDKISLQKKLYLWCLESSMLGLMFGGQPLEECRSEAAETVGEAPEADSGRMASISLDSYEKSRSEKGLLLVFDLARSNWMKTEIAGIP